MNADLRAQLDLLIQSALRAADPAASIHRHLRRTDETLWVDGDAYDLRAWDDVRLIAAGKAAVPMAQAVIGLLADRLTRVVVVTKHGHSAGVRWPALNVPLTLIEAGHPLPDAHSQRAGEVVCAALHNTSPRTLIVVCVSGGASALVVAPHAGISLAAVRVVNEALLRSGLDIREMNAVRARLDRLKGGGLVRLAQPARVLALILSDVVGDPLDAIASGLTNDPGAHNVLVGNNAQACQAAAEAAAKLGFATHVVTTTLTGEARDCGRQIAHEVAEAHDVPACLIYGGETTVTVRGDGKGGRNQELALAAAIAWHALRLSGRLAEDAHCALAALGSDGSDGPTDAAGAFAFDDTVQRANALCLDPHDYLARNDSYAFFDRLGDLIRTGPTGTNVADVIIALRI
jgi:glycerate 2-kinase